MLSRCRSNYIITSMSVTHQLSKTMICCRDLSVHVFAEPLVVNCTLLIGHREDLCRIEAAYPSRWIDPLHVVRKNAAVLIQISYPKEVRQATPEHGSGLHAVCLVFHHNDAAQSVVLLHIYRRPAHGVVELQSVSVHQTTKYCHVLLRSSEPSSSWPHTPCRAVA